MKAGVLEDGRGCHSSRRSDSRKSDSRRAGGNRKRSDSRAGPWNSGNEKGLNKGGAPLSVVEEYQKLGGEGMREWKDTLEFLLIPTGGFGTVCRALRRGEGGPVFVFLVVMTIAEIMYDDRNGDFSPGLTLFTKSHANTYSRHPNPTHKTRNSFSKVRVRNFSTKIAHRVAPELEKSKQWE